MPAFSLSHSSECNRYLKALGRRDRREIAFISSCVCLLWVHGEVITWTAHWWLS